ncbi:MAG: dipeptidase PepV [Clostridiales bacterium]|nr:dipeptidase PepV [Clostridiales bacterium]
MRSKESKLKRAQKIATDKETYMGYLERLDSYKEDMLRTLGETVSKPSVKADPVRTADGKVWPFGQGVQEALECMLQIGEAEGFSTCNDDNYAGHIEWKANEGSDGYFGIVGHLDVVPVGTGWSTDPFTMVDKGDGFVYGRGTSDDKGPVVACLYAMKALREEGYEPKMDIRLVLGLDEETGHISAEHYVESFGHPAMGFTPDADFPLVNGEMGILVFELARKFTSKPGKDDTRLTKLEGGVAHNAVPAYAKAVITGSKEHYEVIIDRARLFTEETGYRLKAKKQGTSLVIEAFGTAAHGAHPELGLNAVSILMDFLGRISFTSEETNDFIAFYNDNIGFDLHGERMGCFFEDEASGPLIFNVGVANINEDIATVSVNIRYPVSCTDAQVMGGIESVLEGTPVGIVTRMVQEPIYRDLDDPMVKDMMQAYVDETGDTEAKPMTIGGGTYAKMFNNILAFGAAFPEDENTMHQADEKFSVDSFMKMARVYARAIESLCCE